MYEWCSERWLFYQLSSEQAIKYQVLHTVWYISGERLKEIEVAHSWEWKSYLLHVLIVLRLLAPSAFTWQEKHGCVCTYLTTDRLWSSGLWICQLRLLSTEWCQHGVDIPRTWPSNNGKSWPIWSQVRLHREKVYILLMMNSNVSLVRMEIPVCKNWDRSAVADRWTDRRTDRQTDRQTVSWGLLIRE